MAFHKREQSKDITSDRSRHTTPLPTYYSQQLPRWTSKSAFEDQKVFDVKTESLDHSYPQFANTMPRFDDIPLPQRPQRRRLPRNAILVPWVLATIFFLITLWLASIALGVRLFIILRPAPPNPPIQEIHVVINEDMFRDIASAYTSTVTLSISATTTVAALSAATSIHDGTAMPTTTGEVIETPVADPLAFTGDNDLITRALVPRNAKASPTGFVTVVRVV